MLSIPLLSVWESGQETALVPAAELGCDGEKPGQSEAEGWSIPGPPMSMKFVGDSLVERDPSVALLGLRLYPHVHGGS